MCASPADVAIVGMSCLFPGAPNLDAYWQNILGKVDSITDPPGEAWDPEVYYRPGSSTSDRVYCKRGGYLGELAAFDPLPHGIPPLAVRGAEPDQWLALQLAVDALADAGYAELSPEVRQKTAVILGKGTYLNGGNALVLQHAMVIGQTLDVLQSLHPGLTEDDLETLRQEMRSLLPPMGPETVPGLIPNIIVGRISNRLDLMGPAYTVDAACASSLLAVQRGMRELQSGACDLVLAGGSQVWLPVGTLNVFCQLGALSRSQQIRPFDEDADGTLLGEGIGMVVLKRLADAERDGDRIYAVVKAVGVASDGRGVSVMAPRIEGEELALRLAYEEAGVAPSSIGLVEAHGTGTPVGDVVEIQALTRVFGERQGGLPQCAIGSVKSMISHTMPAAGIAALIKTALSLYHRVLPPTLKCSKPNPKLGLGTSPFYINTDVRPWVHGAGEPRRAGVNAFGFGGINAHAVLEEYLPVAPGSAESEIEHLPAWETELFVLQAASRQELAARAKQLAQFARATADIQPKDLAFSLASGVSFGEPCWRLAMVSGDLADLAEKSERAAARVADPGCSQIKDVGGVYFAAEPLGRQGKLAYLFPGEGAQYANMLADVCLHFPEARECFDQMDRIFFGHPRGYLPSDYIFPRPSWTDDDRAWVEERLTQMDGAIEAVLTANQAVLQVLSGLGVSPDFMVGHSIGEFSAVRAAGILDPQNEAELAEFVMTLNRNYEARAAGNGIPRASLLAVGAERSRVEELALRVGGDVFVAMDNCPHQAVLVGDQAAVARALELVREEGLIYQHLSLDRAYHTPRFAPYTAHLREIFARMPVRAPRVPVFSSTTAAPYPEDPESIRELLVDHWVRPVEFRRAVEELYEQGARIFVEVGPRGNLTSFVDDILRGRGYVCVPADVQRRSSITQLNHLAGMLAAHDVPVGLPNLYKRRGCRQLDVTSWQLPPAAPAGLRIPLSMGFPTLRLPQDVTERYRRTAAPAPSARPPESATEPVADYLETMRQFLRLQEDVMQAYLSGAAPPSATAPAKSPVVPSVGEPAPPPPVEEQPYQAPTVPDVQEPAERQGQDDREQVASRLLQLVSERTGYPEDMLDWNLDLEADLGIDSIKRVEILGSYRQQFGELDGVDFEQLTTLRTLAQIVEILAPDSNGRVEQPRTEPALGPLLGRVLSFHPGKELVAERIFDPAGDLYLRDHTLGRDISTTDPELMALAVMPLTMSLEILAEAAVALSPSQVVIGLSDVRAYRWLVWEDAPQTLRVEATAAATPGHVHVQLRNRSADEREAEAAKTPVLEATVLLGDRYPDPPSRRPLELRDARPSRWTPAKLYAEGMFHGPRWQGVAAVERTGAEGCVARLRVLPFEGFFRELPNPRFAVDPVVLDAAGQVIGFWTMEHFDSGMVIFPFRVEAIEIFGSQPAIGAEVACDASIHLLGEQALTSDIELALPDGGLWMRIKGWQDKRFYLPREFYAWFSSNTDARISSPWPEVLEGWPKDEVVCQRAPAELPSDREFWTSVWGQRVLSRRERAYFRAHPSPPARLLQRLAARTAAKEAVCKLLEARCGLRLRPADVEILPDEHGRPVVSGRWQEMAGVEAPLVSLAHTDGLGVALAGMPGSHLGIDVERLARETKDFEGVAFNAQELQLFEMLPPEQRNEWLMRAWCAKEAVGKALGRGLIDGPSSVEVVAVDVRAGVVHIELRGSLARIYAEFARQPVVAHTSRQGDLIVAATEWQFDAALQSSGDAVVAREVR